ncbi:hypothetical protein K438DRAFT_426029 [Mycena galopus ATCC 62051]|nr:hypothetical protein K438DRAFT_426029 [Mycena galopus ATCC 62051]
MNPDFAFPPRPKPVPRPQPVSQSPTESPHRESNALRASVLDAALALGLGENGSVANWMFNNAVEEEEEAEDEDASSRAPLSATSDEYGNYSYSTPATSTSSHSETHLPTQPQVHFSAFPVTAISTPAPFPEPPAPAPTGGNKLRKARRADGYESDGGYVSDGGKKARVRTKSKTAKDAPPIMPISEPMELVPMSKEEKKRRKKESKSKAPKKKKEKKPSADAGGYETDDGYTSSKPKSGRSRFFSLRKKSADNTHESPPPEPVPELPPMPDFDLPIASRFATTFEDVASSAAPSRSETPLLPPSRPFAGPELGNSGSSASSLSSSANSLLTPGDQDSFESASPGPAGLPDAGNKTLNADQLNPREHSPPSKASNGRSKFAIFRSGSANTVDPSANTSPKQGKHVPAPISTLTVSAPNAALNSRAPSPSLIAASPFVLLTPINTNTNSGPPRAISPSPSMATDNIIPSGDFIVPSRSTSPMPPASSASSSPGPAPNVLAYYNYDVPPPSPPPNAPLPRAPPSSSARAREATKEPTVGIARLRGMSQDRSGGRSLSPSPTATGGLRPVSPNGAGMLSPVSPNGAGGMLRPLSPASAGGLVSPVSPAGVQRGRAAVCRFVCDPDPADAETRAARTLCG